MTNKKGSIFIAWALLLEFPVRYFVAPDPWIHAADHWYFLQPGRLGIEIGFVVLAFLPFLHYDVLRSIVFGDFNRKNVRFLVIGVIIAFGLFSLTELAEISQIHAKGLWSAVPLWFATGLFIGFGQELTFRGLIYTGVKAKAGLKWAVILSTVFFVVGSIHAPRIYAYAINGYVTEALTLLGVFTGAGLFFAWVRTKTDNVIIPAVIHGIGNAVTWATFVVLKLNS
jgi:membrane protease YdiL (CAAX protease family)